MKNLALALCLALVPVTTLAAKPAKAKKEAVETFKVDTAASLAKWEGKKLLGAHQGELKLKGGELTLAGNTLTGGSVEIDMTTLQDLDLKDADSNKKLVTHLKSDDFFSVEKHPTASLKIKKVEKKGDKLQISADLTIKGITNPVSFPATLSVDKNQVKASGALTVDRTKFDIKYRSLKFFADIGDKVIKDDFTVDVNLVATK